MRRRSVLILTIVGIAAIAVGAVPWTLADDHAERQIGKHVNAWTGAGLEVRGAVTLAILPAPRIKFDDVRFTAPDGSTIVTARQFRGQLQLAPLLEGRFVLADATLVDAVLRSRAASATGEIAWAGSLRVLTDIYNRTIAGAAPIARLTVINGAVAGAVPTAAAAVDNINATLTWPAPDTTLTLSGSAIQAGEPIEFSLSGMSPQSIARGGDTDLALRISTPVARAALRGALTDGGRRFDGKADVSTTALERLNTWLDLRLPVTGRNIAASIEATCSLAARGLSLTSAAVKFNGSSLEGALTVRPGDTARWALAGTLAADDLDFRSRSFASWEAGAPLFTTERLKAWELDLRLSAGRIRLNPELTAKDVAASILLRNSKIEAVIAAAGVLDGAVKGRIALSQGASGGVELRSQITADQIDAGKLSEMIAGPFSLKGPLSGVMTLETRGASRNELAQQLEGRGQFEIGEGEASGINFPELLRGAGQRQVAEPARLRGRTSFNSMRATWNISRGMLAFEDLNMISTLANTNLKGTITLTSGALALSGQISPLPFTANGIAAPFRISGSWATPVLELLPTTAQPEGPKRQDIPAQP